MGREEIETRENLSDLVSTFRGRSTEKDRLILWGGRATMRGKEED